MPLINRNMDLSVRREIYPGLAGLVATGATFFVASSPYPCSCDVISVSALGVSGSPTVAIQINRFITGVGFTAINLVPAQAVSAYGTSGAISLSLPSIGATLSTLSPGDLIVAQLGGTNSAVSGLAVNVVLRPIQDIVKFYGV